MVGLEQRSTYPARRHFVQSPVAVCGARSRPSWRRVFSSGINLTYGFPFPNNFCVFRASTQWKTIVTPLSMLPKTLHSNVGFLTLHRLDFFFKLKCQYISYHSSTAVDLAEDWTATLLVCRYVCVSGRSKGLGLNDDGYCQKAAKMNFSKCMDVKWCLPDHCCDEDAGKIKLQK